MTGRFSKLKENPKSAAPAPTPAAAGTGAKARENKTMIGGYFSKEASRAVRTLAAKEGTTVQALVGEGLDLLLRDRGEHPFGER